MKFLGKLFNSRKRIKEIYKNIDKIYYILKRGCFDGYDYYPKNINFEDIRFNKEDINAQNFYFTKKDFKKEYVNLIKGLDEESITTINRIIARIIMFQQLENKEKFIPYSSEEAKAIREINRDFTDYIIKLNDNCFAYKDYLLPINKFEDSVFFYKHSIHAIKNLTTIKQKDIIDVGGFIGDSAIVLAKFTDKNVYTFEPCSQNYELIKKTLELNSSKNIIPVKLGLGSKTENLYLELKGDQSKIIQGKDSNIGNKEQIKITTLDQYVAENNLNVGLIKVDIEGFEQEFLRGALETIKNQKPALLISIYHNMDDFFNIKPMIEDLNLGYKLTINKSPVTHIFKDTLLVAQQP